MAVPKQPLKEGSEVIFDHTPQPVFMVSRKQIGVGYTASEALGVIGEYAENSVRGPETEGHYEVTLNGLKFTVTVELVY